MLIDFDDSLSSSLNLIETLILSYTGHCLRCDARYSTRNALLDFEIFIVVFLFVCSVVDCWWLLLLCWDYRNCILVVVVVVARESGRLHLRRHRCCFYSTNSRRFFLFIQPGCEKISSLHFLLLLFLQFLLFLKKIYCYSKNKKENKLKIIVQLIIIWNKLVIRSSSSSSQCRIVHLHGILLVLLFTHTERITISNTTYIVLFSSQ